jgi:hypothetical protein
MKRLDHSSFYPQVKASSKTKMLPLAKIESGVAVLTVLGGGYSSKEPARQFKISPFGTYTWRENLSLGENPRTNTAMLVKE